MNDTLMRQWAVDASSKLSHWLSLADESTPRPRYPGVGLPVGWIRLRSSGVGLGDFRIHAMGHGVWIWRQHSGPRVIGTMLRVGMLMRRALAEVSFQRYPG